MKHYDIEKAKESFLPPSSRLLWHANLPYSTLRDAILAHPTMVEALGPLFANMPEVKK